MILSMNTSSLGAKDVKLHSISIPRIVLNRIISFLTSLKVRQPSRLFSNCIILFKLCIHREYCSAILIWMNIKVV